jgi:glutathione synthase/RimK-type ligase-like ATP-grasp enzyme
MKKLLYVFRRILSLDYKSFFQTINELHKRSGKSRIWLFFDIIYCGFKYGAGYLDYKWFQFYDLSPELRSTYITRMKNNQIVRLLNDPEYYDLVDNKVRFLKLFKDYVHRDWLYLPECEYADFEAFVSKHDEMMIKSVYGTGGHGVRKIYLKDFENVRSMYDYILAAKMPLVEECIKQHEDINRIYPYSVNTYRILTIRDEQNTDLIFAYIRIGNNGSSVDNHHSGGMSTPIDLNSGKILYPAIDIEGNLFDSHPMTGTKLLGYQLPCWKEAVAMVKEAAQIVPQLRYIGWDVAISEDGPLLIEGNHLPGYDSMQLPAQNPDRVGFLPLYRKYVKNI